MMMVVLVVMKMIVDHHHAPRWYAENDPKIPEVWTVFCAKVSMSKTSLEVIHKFFYVWRSRFQISPPTASFTAPLEAKKVRLQSSQSRLESPTQQALGFLAEVPCHTAKQTSDVNKVCPRRAILWKGGTKQGDHG